MENMEQFLRVLAYEEKLAQEKLRSVCGRLQEYEQKNSSIVIKKIRGNLYYYEQWREDGKLCARSLGAVAPGSIAKRERSLLERKELEEEKKNLEQLLEQLERAKKHTQTAVLRQPILAEYTFEVYWKDEITARVYVKKHEARISRYVEHPVKQLFADSRMTRDQLNQVLALRCWDKNRPDLPQLLQHIGLTAYNPQQIVRKTHGVTWNDYIWFRFPGEMITGHDVLLRSF